MEGEPTPAFVVIGGAACTWDNENDDLGKQVQIQTQCKLKLVSVQKALLSKQILGDVLSRDIASVASNYKCASCCFATSKCSSRKAAPIKACDLPHKVIPNGVLNSSNTSGAVKNIMKAFEGVILLQKAAEPEGNFGATTTRREPWSKDDTLD